MDVRVFFFVTTDISASAINGKHEQATDAGTSRYEQAMVQSREPACPRPYQTSRVPEHLAASKSSAFGSSGEMRPY